MDHTQILPDIGAPVSTALLNLDALDTASPGEIAYAATVLNKIAATKLADPATYHQLATFTAANGADWSGHQSTRAAEADPAASCHTQPCTPPVPTPPDNYVDSMPAMGSMIKQLGRAHDVMLANYARMLDSVMVDQLTYLGTPHIDTGFRDTKHYLRDVLKLSAHTAEKHLNRAANLTHSPGGNRDQEVSQPRFPQLAASFTAGHLPGENADRILTMDKDLTKYASKVGKSTELKDRIMQAMESGLVEAGETDSPEELSQTKHRWMDRIAYEISPDGPSPAQALAIQADNALRTRRNADGSGRIWMDTTPEVFAKFNNLLLHQANFNGSTPDICPEIAELLAVDGTVDLNSDVPVEDPAKVVGQDDQGQPITAGHLALIDRMTRGQRLGAIVVGMLNTLLSMDPAEINMKKAHGASAQLVIVQDIETAYATLNYPDLPEHAQRPSGPASFQPTNRPGPNQPDDQGSRYTKFVNPATWTPFQSEALNNGPMHPADAKILGCDTEIVAQLWNGPDTVLQQKRTKRHHTPAQRRAILARDRGCQAPGCTIPGVYCDIHHIVAWLLGGDTDETNAVTLCPHHHTAIHLGKWTIRKIDGMTYFQPAAWVDPYQPLLRNSYWKN